MSGSRATPRRPAVVLGESNTMPRPVSLWAVSTTDTIDRSRSTFLHRNPRVSYRRNPVYAMNRNIGPHRVGSAEVKTLATTLASGALTPYRGTDERSTAEQTLRFCTPAGVRICWRRSTGSSRTISRRRLVTHRQLSKPTLRLFTDQRGFIY